MARTLAFPTRLAPAAMSKTILAKTVTFTSQYTGSTQTVAALGQVWKFSLEYSDLWQDLKDPLLGVIYGVGGAAGRLYCHDFSRPEPLGSVDASERLQNGDFMLGLTSWSQTPSDGSIEFSGGYVQLVKGSTGSPSISQSVTLSAGTNYVLTVDIGIGTSNLLDVLVGSTNGAEDLATANYTSPGRYTLGFTASATTYITLSVGTAASAGDYCTVQRVSVAYAPLTSGASQAGSLITVDGLPASSSGLLVPGDMVGINGELRQVVSPVHSDSSGAAKLQLDYPLRSAVPDNTPVVLNRPSTRFMLTDDSVSEAISAPVLSSVSINLLEAIT